MAATGVRECSEPHRPDAAQVELILSQIESLPGLPIVADRLVELYANNKVSVRRITELIQADPMLSSRLLSMFDGTDGHKSADTIEQLLDLLGAETVGHLVISMQISEMFMQRVESVCTRLDHVGFWKHSLAVGCAARSLAEQIPNDSYSSGISSLNPEEVFACGLLHDIGKVLLAACFPKSYDRVLAMVEDFRGCIAEMERRVFGLDHASAGRRLAISWKLPAMFQECIWLHHHTSASTPKRIGYPVHVRLVQLADRLTRQMRIGYSGNYQEEGISLSAISEEIGISEEALEDIRSSLDAQVEARAEMIGLDRLTLGAAHKDDLSQIKAELVRVNVSLAEAKREFEQKGICFELLRLLSEGVGTAPTHEQVCRVGVKAVKIVAPDSHVAVLGFSASRSIVVAAAEGVGAEPVKLELLPASAAGDWARLAKVMGTWLPASILSEVLIDRLSVLLGEPPVWCRPIGHHGKIMGAIIITSDPPTDTTECFTALSDGLGIWLNCAELLATTQQLNEELTEANIRVAAEQAEVARTRFLSMVGELAAGAAHELNNPLAVISGRAQMLNREGIDREVRRSAAVIAEHADRASAIISELMAFAKPAPPNPTVWSIAELLGEIRRNWIGKNILSETQFRLELSDGLPKVRADASQIRILFDEIIGNAAEAMGEVDDPLLIINCRANLADEGVVVRIQDNGCGMSQEVAERALTPFYSYRPAGRGRGLGLSQAARYAWLNGGHIRISSRLGEGTAVFIQLPATDEE